MDLLDCCVLVFFLDNRIGDCYLHSDGDPNAPICTDPIGIGITKATCCCTHVEAWGNPCELCPDFNTTEVGLK